MPHPLFSCVLAEIIAMVDHVDKTNVEPVTLAITHQVIDGQQASYEQWLQKIIPIAEQFQGHRGVNVIRPSHDDTTYTVLLHFDSFDNLYHWTKSPERQTLIEEIKPSLATDEKQEVKPGAEFWFTPPNPNVSKPPLWKQFVISIAVIFPSTNIVPWFWGTLLPQLNGTLLGHFLNDATVAALMVYLWMPLLTRLLANWLKAR